MIDPLNRDLPLFTVEQTAHAIGRSFQLIKKWQGAGIPLIQPDDDPGSAGRGRRARYTLRTVTTLALMAELTAWGVPAEIAWNSAIQFTHLDDGPPAGYADGPRSIRDEAGFYTRGETYLVVHDQRKIAELVNVAEDAPFKWPKDADSSTLLINCEKLVKRVIARLEAKEKVEVTV